MQGKTVVITGGTSGIGEVAALKLAAMGARIVLVARSKNRAEATLAKLGEAAPRQAHKAHYADLSLIADMKRVGAEILGPLAVVDGKIGAGGSGIDDDRDPAFYRVDDAADDLVALAFGEFEHLAAERHTQTMHTGSNIEFD